MILLQIRLGALENRSLVPTHIYVLSKITLYTDKYIRRAFGYSWCREVKKYSLADMIKYVHVCMCVCVYLCIKEESFQFVLESWLESSSSSTHPLHVAIRPASIHTYIPTSHSHTHAQASLQYSATAWSFDSTNVCGAHAQQQLMRTRMFMLMLADLDPQSERALWAEQKRAAQSESGWTRCACSKQIGETCCQVQQKQTATQSSWSFAPKQQQASPHQTHTHKHARMYAHVFIYRYVCVCVSLASFHH